MTIRAVLIALPTLFLGWIFVLVAVMLVSDAAPAAAVLFPGKDLLANLPGDTAILDTSPVSVTLSSDRPSFARALYAHGALLVLPAGLIGCLPLPKPSV